MLRSEAPLKKSRGRSRNQQSRKGCRASIGKPHKACYGRYVETNLNGSQGCATITRDIWISAC